MNLNDGRLGHIGVGSHRVKLSWVLLITLVNLGTYVAFFGPLQILLPMHAEALEPGRKEWAFAVVSGFGAAISLFANPLFGALSDRTRSRFGRRVPWISAGSVGGAFGLVILSSAQSLIVMIIGWCLVQLAVNASLAAVTATLPDQVPVEQRAWAGGWVSLGQTFGVLVGAGLAIAFGGYQAGYLACAAFLVLSALPYIFRSKDEPLTERPDWNLAEFIRSFWISPAQHPDFAWAWIVRFVVGLANAIATLYLLYFLQDAVGLKDPEGGMFILITLYTVVVSAAAVGFGVLSDKLGIRREFVAVSGFIMLIASVLLAFWQTWPGALVAAAILGLGYGIFMAVDLAIVTEVLPNKSGFAKDMGVINIANASPQVLAPVIAAPIVVSAGGYMALYLLSGALGVLGTILVFRIKGVR